MLSTPRLFGLSAACLLQIFAVALANGHDGGASGGAKSPGEVISRPNLNVTNAALRSPSTYFHLDTSRGWIYIHVLAMVAAWCFVLPITVGVIYNGKTPDLYPGNSHHQLGWALSWIYAVHTVTGIVGDSMERRRATIESGAERQHFIPVSTEALAEHDWVDEEGKACPNRYSYDSGQGTDRASSSLQNHSLSPTEEQSQTQFTRKVTFASPISDPYVIENPVQICRIDAFLARRLPMMSYRILAVIHFSTEAINRLMLPLGFVALTTGIVAYSGIFMGSDVFNGLAHFIKGGIFFWYGLFTLGRYVGSFADYGWVGSPALVNLPTRNQLTEFGQAWNVKPTVELIGKRKARIPSAEFVESFMIFTYGISNVFLEHLAAWGKEWTPMDLEHVSISILFFGGGLCGMLVESTRIRNLLNTAMSSFAQNRQVDSLDPEELQPPRTYQFSFNPFAALIIFLLGLMMSSHHQSSMMSSLIHKQWGMLLIGSSLARVATYIMLYVTPPTSIYPSRPPSELIASFCLISGGVIFMASNRSTVTAMITYNLDAMFIFTVTMGFTAFLMAWTILVIAVRGWAVTK
ncbi:MAG: hypothetical protein M1814_006507 [Vezdaea aestivalis]|nr:MAG: hypothetical protein M1814_006507 [Vezdaea aestivalis]